MTSLEYVQFWTKINLLSIPKVETSQPILPYAKRGTGVYGGTKFADLTAEEFKERHLGLYTKVKLVSMELNQINLGLEGGISIDADSGPLKT